MESKPVLYFNPSCFKMPDSGSPAQGPWHRSRFGALSPERAHHRRADPSDEHARSRRPRHDAPGGTDLQRTWAERRIEPRAPRRHHSAPRSARTPHLRPRRPGGNREATGAPSRTAPIEIGPAVGRPSTTTLSAASGPMSGPHDDLLPSAPVGPSASRTIDYGHQAGAGQSTGVVAAHRPLS